MDESRRISLRRNINAALGISGGHKRQRRMRQPVALHRRQPVFDLVRHVVVGFAHDLPELGDGRHFTMHRLSILHRDPHPPPRSSTAPVSGHLPWRTPRAAHGPPPAHHQTGQLAERRDEARTVGGAQRVQVVRDLVQQHQLAHGPVGCRAVRNRDNACAIAVFFVVGSSRGAAGSHTERSRGGPSRGHRG